MRLLLVEILSWAALVAGSFFTVVGMIGLVRMPDVYTRLHAASVTDTLGAGLVCIGLMLQAGLTLVSVKLLFIMALLFFTGPAITHALAQAALHAGVEPLLDEDRRGEPAPRQPSSPAPPATARAAAVPVAE